VLGGQGEFLCHDKSLAIRLARNIFCNVHPSFRVTGILPVLAAVHLAFSAASAASPGAPAGEYAELHSCEVYTGGCTASAQSTTGGRSLLRVWKFDHGAVGATPLDGLCVIVLEQAEANLALPDTRAKQTVAYLPSTATEAQRQALRKFLSGEGLSLTSIKTLPISYSRDGGTLSVRAGDGVEFSTRALEHCDSGGCGEQLWYAPRGMSGSYTVLVNDHSRVEEPDAQLIWRDNAAKSVFFGRFGLPAKPEFTLASIL
jgi:hypothetical protein